MLMARSFGPGVAAWSSLCILLVACEPAVFEDGLYDAEDSSSAGATDPGLPGMGASTSTTGTTGSDSEDQTSGGTTSPPDDSSTGTLGGTTTTTPPGGTTPGGCNASGDGMQDPALAELECEQLELTNLVRSEGADCGVYGWFGSTGPLTMQDELRYAARVHSYWMADTGSFSHDSPGGPLGDSMSERITEAGYDWRQIAENIASGYSTASDVTRGWVDSDGHCANLMDPDLEEIGIGIAEGGQLYWTQDFGTPW
jgi:uncharacterized protein YkwD